MAPNDDQKCADVQMFGALRERLGTQERSAA
jgi:hypothetical protein